MPSRIVIAGVFLGVLVLAAAGGPALAAAPDWKAVEQALGKTGQLQAGDVFRVGVPRTDLSVTVKGVAGQGRLAPRSYGPLTPGGGPAPGMGGLRRPRP